LRLASTMAKEFKLKDVTLLNLKDGELKEVEVEGIEGGKVLLSGAGGKVHATSTRCTHYGAPLAKGVLSPEGRLTCPWHGACFNVTTGDVEDAPALNPLAKYELVQKDGAVYVQGDEKVIKENLITASHKCAATGDGQVVIVGGGSGAIGVIHALRENGYTAPIKIISSEQYLPIDRPKLSKALIVDSDKIRLRPKEWFDSASIEHVTDEVNGIDFEKKTVSTMSGKTHAYTKLVLATGGIPRKLSLPGFDLGNIFTLRTVNDVQKIMEAVGDKGKKIVVVGSSFIGMEIGNALSKENNVTIISDTKVPIERVVGEQVGAIFQRILEKNGVKFHMSTSVDKATPGSDSSNVGAVHLMDGTIIEADLVVLGVGVMPNTLYLKGNSSVMLEKDGSLKTDTSFAVEGLQDVYAVGDIASYPYHGPGGNGAITRIEHWNVAQNQGRTVGKAIASSAPSNKPIIPIFWSALGSQLRYCGNTVNGWDKVIIKGEPDQNKIAAYYANGDVVVAVATVGMDPVMAKSADLMRRDKMPTRAQLERGVDPLSL